MDSILARCDPITTFEDAKRPVITPLLPVKGLRRDASGVLTNDSIRTILDGLQSYGLAGPTEEAASAILMEARSVLCTLNGQYQFLLDSFLTQVARAEAIDAPTLGLIREKNQQMQDIISLSRQVLTSTPAAAGVEGFQVAPSFTASFATHQTAMRLKEGFQVMFQTLQTDATIMDKQRYADLKQRRYEDSKEKNTYVDRQLGLYTFLNVFAIGLFVYIVSFP
jgi:hypothetical protein